VKVGCGGVPGVAEQAKNITLFDVVAGLDANTALLEVGVEPVQPIAESGAGGTRTSAATGGGKSS
jgi:hypothetical protein